MLMEVQRVQWSAYVWVWGGALQCVPPSQTLPTLKVYTHTRRPAKVADAWASDRNLLQNQVQQETLSPVLTGWNSVLHQE